MDGRVKTLHPRLYAGLLAVRSDQAHVDAAEQHDIEYVDLVCVNLYPFERSVARRLPEAEIIENIDIGGPTMIRAAAKNHAYAAVVTSPESYDAILDELGASDGHLSTTTRESLAAEAFAYTARYDTAVARWFAEKSEDFPPLHVRAYEKVLDLPYGENPHQRAAYYTAGRGADRTCCRRSSSTTASSSRSTTCSTSMPRAASCASSTSRRASSSSTTTRAASPSARARWTPTSAPTPPTRSAPSAASSPSTGRSTPRPPTRLSEQFVEVLFAPGYDDDAMEILTRKPNDPDPRGQRAPRAARRRAGHQAGHGRAARPGPRHREPRPHGDGGRRRSASRPTPSGRDLLFAWRVCKHVRSNAIVLARDQATIGIGAGQMSRVDSVRLAVDKSRVKSLQGAVLASDAFFPFTDGPEIAIGAGVTAIIQPGGSRNDPEVREAADKAQASRWSSRAGGTSATRRVRRALRLRRAVGGPLRLQPRGAGRGSRARRRDDGGRRGRRRAVPRRRRRAGGGRSLDAIEAALAQAGARLDRGRPHADVRHRHHPRRGDRPRPRDRFGAIAPVATMVQVAALIDPRMLVEIEADAYVSAIPAPSRASRSVRATRRPPAPVRATPSPCLTRPAGLAGLRARGGCRHWNDGSVPAVRRAPGAGKTIPSLVFATRLLTPGSCAASRRLPDDAADASVGRGRRPPRPAAAARRAELTPPRDFHGVVGDVRPRRARRRPAGRAQCTAATRWSSPTRPTTSARSWPGARASPSRSARRARWLLLSGTPFRSDQSADRRRALRRTASPSPTSSYTYADAVRDGICRPVVVHPVRRDALVAVRRRHHRVLVRHRADRRARPPAATARRSRPSSPTACRGSCAPPTRRLGEVARRRATGTPAASSSPPTPSTRAGSPGCSRRSPARRRSSSCTPRRARREKLQAFGTDRERWIVAVNMVSEGVDIPRLRVGVYARAAKTPLIFRQVVGRFVRTIAGRARARATSTCRPTGCCARTRPTSRASCATSCAAGRAGSGRRSTSARSAARDRAVRGRRVRAARRRRRTADRALRRRRRRRHDGARAAVFAGPAPPSPRRRPRELPAFERRTLLRDKRHGLVGDLAGLRRALAPRDQRLAEPGRPASRAWSDATIDQLERSIEVLLAELDRRGRRRAAS